MEFGRPTWRLVPVDHGGLLGDPIALTPAVHQRRMRQPRLATRSRDQKHSCEPAEAANPQHQGAGSPPGPERSSHTDARWPQLTPSPPQRPRLRLRSAAGEQPKNTIARRARACTPTGHGIITLMLEGEPQPTSDFGDGNARVCGRRGQRHRPGSGRFTANQRARPLPLLQIG